VICDKTEENSGRIFIPTTVCHAGQQWHGLHTVTIRYSTEGVGCQKQMAQSFANNPIRPGLYFASIHQMAPPKWGSTHLIIVLLLIYRPRKDERRSWPGWLTCSGRFTHISGHPSAAGRAQDMESLPTEYRRSTTVYATNQQCVYVCIGFNHAEVLQRATGARSRSADKTRIRRLFDEDWRQ